MASPFRPNRALRDTLTLLIPCLGLLIWLWPLGLGGAMPVGGDVTQFSMGLMAFLGRSLRAGRLPYWNDLWGYGFPGIGESQMGVFYPPHWILYGLLPVETAYTSSLLLHLEWGAVGAWWAARRFGVSPLGAALAAVAWSMSGFFVIHLSHQWSYTTGCWLPWAWGFAWTGLTRPDRRRAPLLLALVLCFQLLPGHFQLAFITQVGVISLALQRGLEDLWQERRIARTTVNTVVAAAGSFVLAAAQIWPTYRLARLASTRRDFEYLSGFAASPMHLITWLAPGLFERSPLWRPIVWDPFHTSPEEYLGYVGLVPLALALILVLTSWRRSPAVRALTLTAAVGMFLGLGPYVPGFRLLIGLPGFSFFRAPARWMIGASFAVAVLGGLGIDELVQVPDAGRRLRRFLAASAALVLGVVLVVEGSFHGEMTVGGLRLGRAYEWGLERLPWGETGVYRQVVLSARRPNLDLRVQESLARQGVVLSNAPRPVFVDQRWQIYGDELGWTALLLLAVFLVSVVVKAPTRLTAGLLVLTMLDLLALGRHRRIDVAPLGSLVARSPVLTELARQPGTRTVDPLRNLPMVAGVNPISAYRTLDLPALESITALAGRSDAGGLGERAARIAGASVRVVDPLETRGFAPSPTPVQLADAGHVLEDPSLASWRYGVDWVAQTGRSVTRFRIKGQSSAGKLAWFLPGRSTDADSILGAWSGDANVVLRAFETARPLEVTRLSPERWTIGVDAPEPGYVLVTQLFDPQWNAGWTGPGSGRDVPISRAFGRPGAGAWQLISVPEAGRGTLTLTYRATDVRAGLGVSAAAFSAWMVLWWRMGRERRSAATVVVGGLGG